MSSVTERCRWDRREGGSVIGEVIVVGGRTSFRKGRGFGGFFRNTEVGSWMMMGREESLEFIDSIINILSGETTSILLF